MNQRAVSCLLIRTLIAAAILSCCKKDEDDVKPTDSFGATCVIINETSSLIGNETSLTYEYDDRGNPSQIKWLNTFGNVAYLLEVVQDGVAVKHLVDGEMKPSTSTNYQGNFLIGSPTQASISITVDGITTNNWKTYFFFYDSKGRVERIGEQTSNVIGDYEWDLTIFYDKDDNVSTLKYEFTTGPRDLITTITVDAYDDNPTPYAGVKGYKFLGSFNWDNYDPEPIITALSKNNPLNYTMGTGVTSEFKRTMTYEYNEQGFPTQRTNTNKNANGESTFIQTFGYTCK
jgi:YD repeat-containing protein